VPVGGVSHFGAGDGLPLVCGPPSKSVSKAVDPDEVEIQIDPQLLPLALWQVPITSFQYMSVSITLARLSSTLYEMLVMYV
jgi:hypothetical protein